ncbi:hypothetical protein ACE01N_06810 [Saccharicrinis sp. FJH2]|uniref:hypothetical protein n=1 Tax=Saccharicrinis sp. FJH65 TaxID=3344659 RepID=UPI0035F3A8B7
MKKGLLIILTIFLFLGSVAAQNLTLNIYKINKTVQRYALSNLDSVQVDEANNNILVHLKDGNITALSISEIDSLTYSEGTYSVPTVELVSADYEYKLDKIICELNVTDGGCAILERGLCWSKTNPSPTVEDNKFSSGINAGKLYASTTGLTLGSTYYVRPYVTNCMGTTYGDAKKIQTLMGNVTYTIDIDKNQFPEYYALIKEALDSACYYYNRYTEFKANIHVYYSSGIPTAQANYHGSIGYGPNTTYMWVGTTMHEMAHYFGSGTSNAYWNNMVNGVWQGPVAKALCQQMTGQELHGDNTHFWPLGINYRSEVSSATDLINHAKLVQAMLVVDGGVPTSW